MAGQPQGREIHVIADNLSGHKTERVELFLAEHPQVKLHFTPTFLPAIAQQLGACQFVFFTHWARALSEKLGLRLAAAFTHAGLDPDRHLRFLPWLSPPEFHALMRRADVCLDTVGFSGFNTALQALECALPMVTREGLFLRGRLASGMLRRIGLHELVARDEQAYVAAAVEVVREPSLRQALRHRIESQRHVLYADPAPIRALETLLLQGR